MAFIYPIPWAKLLWLHEIFSHPVITGNTNGFCSNYTISWSKRHSPVKWTKFVRKTSHLIQLYCNILPKQIFKGIFSNSPTPLTKNFNISKFHQNFKIWILHGNMNMDASSIIQVCYIYLCCKTKLGYLWECFSISFNEDVEGPKNKRQSF